VNAVPQLQSNEEGRSPEELCLQIVENLPVVSWVFSPNWSAILYVNSAFEKVWGMPRSSLDMNPRAWIEFIHVEDLEKLSWAAARSEKGEPFTVEYRIHRPSGAIRWILDRGFPIRDKAGQLCRTVRISEDITERKHSNDRMRMAVQEKLALLKETHHRVKNNLQIISSLLNLQAGRLSDEAVLHCFQESQDRIGAIALIHEQLAHSSQAAPIIDFAEYARELANSLQATWGGGQRPRHTVQLSLAPVSLSVNQAIPLGLILNELVSNCYKHAFPEGRAGEIGVELSLDAEKQCTLRVRDNGIGFPPQAAHSLGLKLVARLSKQLRATLQIRSDQGAQVIISLPLHKGSA
jgi:PAS domain S-box-containing protein